MTEFDGLPNDFEVNYRFLSEAEGGRKNQTFFQGYRCDWVYEDFEEAEPRQAWMMWPLFLDEMENLLQKARKWQLAERRA